MFSRVRIQEALWIGLMWAIILTVVVGLFSHENQLRDFHNLLFAGAIPDDLKRTSPEIYDAYALSPNYVLQIGQALAFLFDPKDPIKLHTLYLILFFVEAAALSCGMALALAKFTEDRRFIWIGLALGCFSAIGFYPAMRGLDSLTDGVSIGAFATSFNILAVGLYFWGQRLLAILVSVACMNVHVINGGLGIALVCAVEAQRLIAHREYRGELSRHLWNSIRRWDVLAGCLVIILLLAPILFRLATVKLPSMEVTADYVDFLLHRTSHNHPLRDGFLITATPFIIAFLAFWVSKNTAIHLEARLLAKYFILSVLAFLVLQICVSDLVFVPLLATIQWQRTNGTLQLMLVCILIARLSQNAAARPLGVWIPFVAVITVMGIRAPFWLGSLTLSTSDPSGMYADYLLILSLMICILLADDWADLIRKAAIVLLPLYIVIAVLFAIHAAAIGQLACDKTDPSCVVKLWLDGRKTAQFYPEIVLTILIIGWAVSRRLINNRPSSRMISAAVAAIVGATITMAWIMHIRDDIPKMLKARTPFYDWNDWSQQNPLGEAVAKVTPSNAVVFAPFAVDLVTYREQYFDNTNVVYKTYSSPQSVANDARRLAALGIYFDARSPARRACEGFRGYATFRCMSTWPGLYQRLRSADWRTRLRDMRSVEPRLSAVVLNKASVLSSDVVLGTVDNLVIVDVRSAK